MIKEFLEKISKNKKNIHIIGDAMVDEYYDVSVHSISPEFPMPVMRSEKINPIKKPGGAANVAYQLKHCNVDVTLQCFYDKKLSKVLKNNSISYKKDSHKLPKIGYVPVKKRFLDNGVQVKRWDIEADRSYGVNVLNWGNIDASQLNKYNVVIMSDYGKGYFDGMHNWTKHFNCPIIVDPKNFPIFNWKGCTIFKLNEKEAKELSKGEVGYVGQAKYFKRNLECEAVVITHGGGKVAGIWGDELFEYTPQTEVKVESVVGAGDCFVAFLALAVAHGYKGVNAVQIANEAGLRYVQSNFNRPIVPAELSKTKIVEPEDLKNRDFTLAITNGCFDILHEGHLETLKFAKEKEDKLVVAINSDKSVKNLKGDSRPIKPLEQRMKLMAAIEYVDFVVSFDEDTPYEIIKKIKPESLIKGSQYQEEEISGADIVKNVYRAPMINGLSTTNFLNS